MTVCPLRRRGRERRLAAAGSPAHLCERRLGELESTLVLLRRCLVHLGRRRRLLPGAQSEGRRNSVSQPLRPRIFQAGRAGGG